MQRRTLLRRLCLSIAATLAALAVAWGATEIGLRIIHPSVEMPDDDPVLGIRPPLTADDHDSRGFRNAEALLQADIVVLGDSQTYGNSAEREDAWPQDLARLTHASVYQMAYGGWSMLQYGALVTQALTLHPRTLIVAFYTGNDLLETTDWAYELDHWKTYRQSTFVPHDSTDAAQDVRLALDNGSRPGSMGLTLFKARTWLQEHSRVYVRLGPATYRLRAYLGLVESEDARATRVESFRRSQPDLAYYATDAGIDTVLSPTYRRRAVDLADPDAAEGWRITQVLATEIRDEAARAGVRLLFAIIPTKELAYLELWKRHGAAPPAQFEAYERAERRLWNEVGVFCGREKLECVFTLDALAGALDEGIRAYNEDTNGHPRAEGYAAIAREVQKALH